MERVRGAQRESDRRRAVVRNRGLRCGRWVPEGRSCAFRASGWVLFLPRWVSMCALVVAGGEGWRRFGAGGASWSCDIETGTASAHLTDVGAEVGAEERDNPGLLAFAF